MTRRPPEHDLARPRSRRRRPRRSAALAALVIGALPLTAAAPAPPVQQAPALQSRIEEIIRGTGWSSSEWSVLVYSLDTGDTLFARAPGQPLAPASNMKLVTTAAALHYLGPDFRYRTFVLGDGAVDGGRLEGDLVLYGTGDPGISDRFHASRTTVFEALADQLLQAGVREVSGDVVGDGSYFAGPVLAQGWDPRDLNDWFAAPAGALSFNENVVTLRVEPGPSEGARPRVHTLPENAMIPVDNRATTGRGRIRIRRDHPTEPVDIDGAVPRGGREVWRQVTVGDPARYAAQIFANVLEQKGIRVAGTVRTVQDPAASVVTGRRLWAPVARQAAPRILAEHVSPPLQEYLEVINKKSHNLLAELALKTVGRLTEGDGSYAGGARAVQRFLADEAGVDTAGIVIHDGSGLSGDNRVSSAAFIGLMDHMAETGLWESFWASLPEAGNPQELRRMYRTAAAGNLRAKTGTIERVSALSGMVRSANGERLAFSIIGNRLPSTWGAKQVEDRIGVQLASFERPFAMRETRLAQAEAEPGADTVDGAPGAAAVEETRMASLDEARVGGPSDEAADTAAEASAPAESAASHAAATPAARTHVVRSGENYTVIARRNGVSLNALLEANPGVPPRSLQPGMRLKVPAAEAGPAPQERTDPRSHVVQRGENFTVIARRYGVSLNELIDANPSVDPNRIRAGQTLSIPPAADDGS